MYARIVAGRHAGQHGPVVRTRAWHCWVQTAGGTVCVHMRDVRFGRPMDRAAVARYRERLLRDVPGRRMR